jgi:hypothetical protein
MRRHGGGCHRLRRSHDRMILLLGGLSGIYAASPKVARHVEELLFRPWGREPRPARSVLGVHIAQSQILPVGRPGRFHTARVWSPVRERRTAVYHSFFAPCRRPVSTDNSCSKRGDRQHQLEDAQHGGCESARGAGRHSGTDRKQDLLHKVARRERESPSPDPRQGFGRCAARTSSLERRSPRTPSSTSQP